jgi:hypothetical protein
VENINDAPFFTSVPDTSAVEDIEYSYTVTAEDVDTDADLFILGEYPNWLTLVDNDDGTAELSGTPTNDDVGGHSIVLTVSDGFVTVNQEFTITVSNTNDAPFFTSTPTTSAVEDAEYSYTAAASDIDVGDNLTYAAPTLPGWLAFDVSTQILSGMPTNDDVGDHFVVLTVNDGTETVNQEFTITVENINDAPFFTSVPDTSAVEDIEYSYTVTAEDVDTDADLFILGEYPNWLTLVDNDDGTAELSGTPTNDDVGGHSIVLTVSDGFVTVNQEFTITVSNTNDAPFFTSTPTTSAVEDAEYSYTAAASDIDVGDNLTYAAPTLPGWLAFDVSTQILSGMPTNDDVGDHFVVLTVNDGTETVNQEFTITVENTNDAPFFTSTPVDSVLEDVEYIYSVIVEDVDVGDILFISGTYPNWLTLIDHGDGTAELSGTPTNDDVGDHSVELIITDNFGETDQQIFTVSVLNTNDPPSITLPSIFSFDEGDSLEVDFSAYITDVDEGDSPVLSVSNYDTFSDTVDFITIDVTGLTINFGVTDPDLSGVVETMFYVTDGIDSDSTNVSVLVNLTNDNPVLSEIVSQEMDEDAILNISLSAMDVDNTYDYLSFSVESDNDSVNVLSIDGPDQAEDDPNIALSTLTMESTGDFHGLVNITVIVSDGFLTDEETFTLTVNPVNDSPVISGQSVLATPEDIALGITLSDLVVTDVDNNPDDFILTVLESDNYTVDFTTVIPDSNYFGDLTVPVYVMLDISFNTP